MPERTIDMVFFIDENGQDHPKGATVDLSADDAAKYDEAIEDRRNPAILDRLGAESAAGQPSQGEMPNIIPPEGESLESLSKEQLQEIATARGIEVEGTGADGNVLKSDLVSALNG